MKIKKVELIENPHTGKTQLNITGENNTYVLTEEQINLGLIEDGQLCEDCDDTGEVTTSEQVYPGEPHMADIGTRACHCKSRDEDDRGDE